MIELQHHAYFIPRQASLFKHKEDRIPAAVALGLTLVDIALYFTLESPWLLGAYWLLMIVPKGTLGAWSHHHQHVATFRVTWMNRVLELSHALHTGVTSNLWMLHHVLGHHVNYLDQTKDESRWKRLDGTPMSPMEYSLNVAATAYFRAYEVGKRYPKHQRVYLTWTAITFALLALTVWHRPLQALFLFVLPMITSLVFTTWVTHDHHAGLDTQDPFAGSVNTLNRRFNVITGNLGFHTAHHLKQSVHWSRLPELHAQIKDKIPAHLYRSTDFKFLLGTDETDIGRQAVGARVLATLGVMPEVGMSDVGMPDVGMPEHGQSQ
jgi:fatty acid desaturase